MKDFQTSKDLDKFILGLLEDDSEYVDNLMNLCDNYLSYDYKPIEAAKLGLDLGDKAAGKPVYAVNLSDNEDDVVLMFIGTEKEIRTKISKDFLDEQEHKKKEKQ